MSLKIAVISDLHCHPRRSETEKNRTHFFSDGARLAGNRHPIEYLLDLIRNKDEPIVSDILALPGDIADQANHQGFVVGVYALREVKTALGAERLVATLGNHDIDSRSVTGTSPFFAAKNMFSDFPIENEVERNRFFNQGFAIIEGDDYRFLSINSVAHHLTKEAAKSGNADDVQISSIEKALGVLDRKKYQIALVHHHPIPHEELNLGGADLLVKGELLLDLLERFSFNLVIHGHKHHPRLRYSNRGKLAVFSSGSLSAAIDPITGSACRNTFHLVELFEEMHNVASPCGTIKTWDLKLDKGWEITNRKSSSFPGETGFGCHESAVDLAAQIDKNIPQPGFLKWSEAKAVIPQLQFLIPSDLEAVASELLNKYKIVLAPDGSDPVMAYRS